MALLRFWAIALLMALAACAEKPQPDTKGAVIKPDTSALLASGDATRNDGRLSEALQIYEKVLVDDPRSIPAEYGMAECLLGLGRTRDARTTFEGLKDDERFRALALQGIGIADLVLNNRQEAMLDAATKSLRDAIAVDPKLWRAYNGLGMVADWERKPDEAAELYGKALAINPNSALLLNNLGYSRLLAGKYDEAIADFRKALNLAPDSKIVQYNLRLAIAAKGDYAQATRNVPNDMQAAVLNNAGYIAMQRGDLKQAESLLWRATEKNPYYDATTAKNLDQLNALKEVGK